MVSHRRSCLNTRIKQIQEEMKENKNSRKIAKLQDHSELQRSFIFDNRELELYPTDLIPPEMWAITFGYLGDAADLKNCMNSCTQFTNMLAKKRTQFLFSEVLPFLAKEMSIQDILNCRKVSQKWCSSIDQIILENTYLLSWENIPDDVPYIRGSNTVVPPPFHFTNKFSLRLDNQLLNARPARQRNAMKSHPRNPLLGRNVSVDVTLIHTADRAAMEPMVKELFSDFGPHLFHVEVSFFGLQFHPRAYFDLICHMLNMCTNLKTLKLTTFIRHENQNYTDDELNFSVDDLPLCCSLQVVQIFEGWQPGLAIEKALITKYSNQLKFLNVWYHHGEIYEGFPWENLTCLDVGGQSTGLGCIEKMDAPKLKKISLRFKESETPTFRDVINVLNHFPVLTICTLKFDRFKSGLRYDEFLKTEHISELASSKTITCLNLELELHLECTLSFDWLIFFPCLERLSIQITEFHREPSLRSLIDDRRTDVIKLVEYINEECFNRDDTIIRPIFRSNIWQILPRLNILKLVRNMYGPAGHRNQNYLFSRSDYEGDLVE